MARTLGEVWDQAEEILESTGGIHQLMSFELGERKHHIHLFQH
jgi:hypothetical protein